MKGIIVTFGGTEEVLEVQGEAPLALSLDTKTHPAPTCHR